MAQTMRGGRHTLVALAVTVIVGALLTSATTAIALAVVGPLPVREPQRAAEASLGPSVTPGWNRGPDGLPQVVGPVLPRSEPVAVDIPAIGVRSPLHPLGMTAERKLMVPSGERYDEAAWYKHSETPGERGPSVILGHVDSPDDGPSVFYRLGELTPGDRIHVTRADGVVAVFKVDGVRSYDKDEFPTRLVYGETRHAALRLITCGGTFDRAARRYRDNVVVFASLDGSRESPRTSRFR